MKKTIAITTALLVLSAATLLNAGISGSISTKYLSEYVAANGFVVHPNAVQQTDLFFALPKGFYTDLWISYPWDGKENLGKEIDGTVAWSGQVANTGLTADIGISYFNYISLLESVGDVINPFAKISKEIPLGEKHVIIPFVKMEFPMPVASTPKGGIYSYFGIQHNWQISKKFSLAQNAYVVYDNGAYDLEKGWIGKYSIGSSYQLGKGFTLSLEVSVFSPLTLMSDRKTEVVPALGLTYNF